MLLSNLSRPFSGMSRLVSLVSRSHLRHLSLGLASWRIDDSCPTPFLTDEMLRFLHARIRPEQSVLSLLRKDSKRFRRCVTRCWRERELATIRRLPSVVPSFETKRIFSTDGFVVLRWNDQTKRRFPTVLERTRERPADDPIDRREARSHARRCMGFRNERTAGKRDVRGLLRSHGLHVRRLRFRGRRLWWKPLPCLVSGWKAEGLGTNPWRESVIERQDRFVSTRSALFLARFDASAIGGCRMVPLCFRHSRR